MGLFQGTAAPILRQTRGKPSVSTGKKQALPSRRWQILHQAKLSFGSFLNSEHMRHLQYAPPMATTHCPVMPTLQQARCGASPQAGSQGSPPLYEYNPSRQSELASVINDLAKVMTAHDFQGLNRKDTVAWPGSLFTEGGHNASNKQTNEGAMW